MTAIAEPIFAKSLRNLAPRASIKPLDWCKENIQTHEGRWFDNDAYPHFGTPGGPFDVFADSSVLEIWLQFASRLGKTFFGTCCQLYAAATNPCPMMLASADQKLATDVTKRTYGMLARCKPLKGQLRPPNRRRQSLIDLADCCVFVAWARSVSTLADKAVRLGHANEIDKWEHPGVESGRAKEADPLKLFDDRFKEFPTHKKIKESTPSVKGRSRIERGRLASTNCRLHVPCPHCGQYQALEFERIKWEKLPSGKHDPDLARRTARYECAGGSCQPIMDEHRGRMLRRGVWCPEGCSVDSAKASAIFSGEDYQWLGWRHATWIIGTPARDGTDAGYQLSSLYATSLSWGAIASEFVKVKDKPQDLRNFINQWLGETWEIVAHQQTWEQLGKRLIVEIKRDIIPSWASLLTVGGDRQKDHEVFQVMAWGPDRRGQTIAYGEVESLARLRVNVLERLYQHEDGGASLRSCFALVDSGHKPDGVNEFSLSCLRDGICIYPCKGSSNALESDYRVTELGKNTSLPGMKLVFVDTIRTQLWMEKVLHTLKPTDPGGLGLHAGDLFSHQDYLEQLLNDAAVMGLDTSNNVRESWERIDANIPNDFRDCGRYGYAAMLVATRGQPIRARTNAPPIKKSAFVNAGATRPDGRPWI